MLMYVELHVLYNIYTMTSIWDDEYNDDGNNTLKCNTYELLFNLFAVNGWEPLM